MLSESYHKEHKFKPSDLKISDLDHNSSLPIITTNSDDDFQIENHETDNFPFANSQTTHLEELITLADLSKAEVYRNENTIRKLVNGQYELYPVYSTTPKTLGEYGAGLELYFIFIKQLGYLFALISLLSIWPIYQNARGAGLVRGAAKQVWTYWCVANQPQINLNDYTEASQQLEDINQNRIVIAIADSIGALCFTLFLFRYYKISKTTVEENFKNNVTAADYAIEVKGLPENFTDTEQVKEHFEQFGEVIEVYLARKYYGMLQDYKERAKISTKLGYERIISASIDFSNKAEIEKLEKKILTFDTELNFRFKNGDLFHENLPVSRAYLIFNKLDNKKQCLESCKVRGICCIKKRPVDPSMFFQENVVLKVKQTTEPSNIIWENLEITKCQRRWRKTLSLLLALSALVASTVVVYLIMNYRSKLPTDSYCLNELKIDPHASFDYADRNYKGNDQSYCYCKYQTWTDILKDKDLGEYCAYFFTKMMSSIFLNLFSSCGIVFINFVLRIIFKKLSRFEKLSNKTKEELNIMVKVFLAIFINTALISLLVNANFRRVSFFYEVPGTKEIFTGTYDDFSREWYINVGDSIIFTIAICIFSPHFLTFCVLYPISICKRRKFYRRYKTQLELNEVFAGPHFDLACRNSIVLNLVFTSYLYSSAIPVLNILTLVALCVIYWTDKYLVLRYYRKPPLLSYHLNDTALKFVPVIIFLHCFFAIYMLGSDDIFPLYITNNNGKVEVKQNTISDRLISIPGAVEGIVILATAALSVILFFYSELLAKCKRGSAKVEEETQDSQGTYKEELEVIKKHGLHSYQILENPEYKNLVISFNSAAQNLQVLRGSSMRKSKSLANLKLFKV